MTARNIAISQRENYTPTRFTIFLWWLSAAEKELLVDSVVDRNRYRIIGMTVLATWAFASLAWTYFFYTFLQSVIFSLLAGFFMGFIILTIDRALIKGISSLNKRTMAPLLFRAILAITIGTFMAQPAVLFMFNKEIQLQASVDNDKKKQFRKQQLDSFYKSRNDDLLNEESRLRKELAVAYDAVSEARKNFLSESDGSGGTGRIGLKDIAIAKRNEYQKLDEEYKAMYQSSQPRLLEIKTALDDINKNKAEALQAFDKQFNNGFLTRIEALSNLLKTNDALRFRYYLVVFILVLIELMPVLAKAMLPSGSYAEKARLREEMEIAIANSNTQKEHQLKELYNRLAFENDSDAITAFFSTTRDYRNEKIQAFSKNWKEANDQSFDGLWEKMKREILSKQEN